MNGSDAGVAAVPGPPEGTFGFDQAVDAIATESRRLAEVVAECDLEAPVPSCPAWSVRDLAHHVGGVQWSWGENVRARDAGRRAGDGPTPLPGDTDLSAWLGWCAYSLLAALRDAGPDAPCWAWWPLPRTAGAVGRHQAQEVAVHRWDAQGVRGESHPLAAGLAADGVPEFVEVMIGPAAADLPGRVTLTATDAGRSWQVTGAAARRAGVPARASELRAPASDLVLMLYRRLPVPDAAVEGDPVLVAALLSLADTS